MIALNPPFPGWIEDDSEFVLVVAIDGEWTVCIKENGFLCRKQLSSIQTDIRYDPDNQRWFPATLWEFDAEEEDSDGGTEIP